MFNKKNLIYAALFLGSFVVMNVGIFFLLKATQPKVGKRIELAKASGAGVSEETKSADGSAKDSAKTVQPGDSAMASQSAAPIATDSIQSGVEKEIADAEKEAAGNANSGDKSGDNNSKSAQANQQATNSADSSGKSSQSDVAEVSASVKGGDAKQLGKLAKLLEGMKPVEAAGIIGQLSDDAIVSLVMKMKDRNAAKMLAALPVDQAGRIADRMSELATR